ncbi:hypothetical protein [Paludibacterium denitrificans]|uniref:hypothetical protein n=1 Tax=Paludibacterium denitrificans TaxID=2675226 RepID=UPI001E5E4D13|nr:hypothetical protein [Paludibacterium denitrificans]
MWVARQMGHSSWLMIGRVYGKWIPDQADAAGEKAVAAFSGHGVKQMLAKKLAE